MFENLASNVRRYRLTRDITQNRLSADSGIGRSTISLIEHGFVPANCDKLVIRLAAALGTSVKALLRKPPTTARRRRPSRRAATSEEPSTNQQENATAIEAGL